MDKSYRMYVTNIDQAIMTLRQVGITAVSHSTGIAFTIPEERKTEIILTLNKAKVIIYDIEEL